MPRRRSNKVAITRTQQQLVSRILDDEGKGNFFRLYLHARALDLRASDASVMEHVVQDVLALSRNGLVRLERHHAPVPPERLDESLGATEAWLTLTDADIAAYVRPDLLMESDQRGGWRPVAGAPEIAIKLTDAGRAVCGPE
jgi:hypothetical protein